MQPATLLRIPSPRRFPFLGHLPHVDTKRPISSMLEKSEALGEICEFQMPGQRLLLIRSQRLVAELADDSRFEKHVHKVLREMRAYAGSGLFTAESASAEWISAHRILASAFAPQALREQFSSVLEIVDQGMAKWERQGPEIAIDLSADMTRLTMDTIALCAFGYRFNSFELRDPHPFVIAMADNLREAGYRARRPRVLAPLYHSSAKKFEANSAAMNAYAHSIVADRLAREERGESCAPDLLGRLLHTPDPVTGQTLSAENVRAQIITFLVAGHETTSGLLAFALQALLNNPLCLELARAEVDRVTGGGTPTFDQVGKLAYLDQVLRETMRLWPSVPSFAFRSKVGATELGGYAVNASDVLLVLVPALHRDPAVWGSDAETFRPERMAMERVRELPKHAWAPFGIGKRACTGRGLAMLEATLALARILQKFNLSFEGGRYELEVEETPSLKPARLFLRAVPRGGAR